MKNIFFFSIFVATGIFLNKISFAQNTFPSTGSAGIGTTAPDASSILEVKSTTQGVLIPRMTKTQRDAIVSPVQGLLIYQTNSTPGFYYYSGTAWTAISGKGANKNLSNLTVPTAVNVDLLPSATNMLNLGNSTMQWKDVNLYNLKFSDGTIQTTAAKSGASKALDNLKAPTAVNVDLLPAQDYMQSLGSTVHSWDNLYLLGSVYLGGSRFLGNNAGTGLGNTDVGVNAGISNSTGASNTCVGSVALNSTTTGYSNVAIGASALYYNDAGHNLVAVGDSALFNEANDIYGYYGNTAVGDHALFSNAGGYLNTANGYRALYSNTNSYNNAFGYKALYSNTAGGANTAVGDFALYSNTTGEGNVATGSSSLYSNTTGDWNSAFGYGALSSNTTGFDNTAFGASSLDNTTTGTSNTAIGAYILISNTTGTANTAIGSGVLANNLTGSFNTSAGISSMVFNTTGSNNTALGMVSLYNSTTASRNTAVGDSAGYNITTGSNNTFVGYGANCGSLGTLTNSTAIGNGATLTASDNFVFGNSSVNGWGFGVVPGSRAIKVGSTSSNGNGAYLTAGGVWTDISDQNKKENITELDKNSVLQKILQLKITEWKYRGTSDEYHIGPMAEDFHRLFEVGDDSSISSMDKTGVLFLGMQALSDENGKLKTDLSRFSRENGDQQKQIEELKSKVDQLQSSILNRESSMSDGFAKLQTSDSKPETILGQNIPNPFDNSTLIPFRIPKDCKDASIMITNTSSSEVISVIPISCNEDHVSVGAGVLASGAYSYTLYVDGKMIDTKGMIIQK